MNMKHYHRNGIKYDTNKIYYRIASTGAHCVQMKTEQQKKNESRSNSIVLCSMFRPTFCGSTILAPEHFFDLFCWMVGAYGKRTPVVIVKMTKSKDIILFHCFCYVQHETDPFRTVARENICICVTFENQNRWKCKPSHLLLIKVFCIYLPSECKQ